MFSGVSITGKNTVIVCEISLSRKLSRLSAFLFARGDVHAFQPLEKHGGTPVEGTAIEDPVLLPTLCVYC